ncbi:MAG TPA: isoprenylcysteine carboxylmethyltransferase family protein [Vicinamibacterales bacterium]|nr:isoprenylcysteine carboxylmethyltransferase family protein [Vicinamibacterales bacterium]
MSFVAFVAAVIVGLMLAENRHSRRHEAILRRQGAVEPPGDVYGALAVLYPAAFLLMAVEGAWRAAAPQLPATALEPSWAAAGVLLFVASKGLKYWAIRTLGERWTFRVLVLPGRPLVTTGPYRYVDHPNYIAVVGELVGAAMMLGARVSGPIMLGVFGVALWARVRFESRALRSIARSA